MHHFFNLLGKDNLGLVHCNKSLHQSREILFLLIHAISSIRLMSCMTGSSRMQEIIAWTRCTNKKTWYTFVLKKKYLLLFFFSKQFQICVLLICFINYEIPVGTLVSYYNFLVQMCSLLLIYANHHRLLPANPIILTGSYTKNPSPRGSSWKDRTESKKKLRGGPCMYSTRPTIKNSFTTEKTVLKN